MNSQSDCDEAMDSLWRKMATSGNVESQTFLSPPMTLEIGLAERLQPDLSSSLVLERCSSFTFLQEQSTQMYYVCDGQEALLKTEQWADAYRGWLALRRSSSLNLQPTPASVEELHDWVSRHQENPHFGQLLYSCDRQFQGLLQYHVRLSETHALRWAPPHPQFHAPGQLVVDLLGRRRHRPAKWVEPRAADSVADALHRSIHTIHDRYQFDLYRFNSEHWARLVITGQSCSFQSADLHAYWLKQVQTQALASGIDPLDCDNSVCPTIVEENLEMQMLLLMAIAP